MFEASQISGEFAVEPSAGPSARPPVLYEALDEYNISGELGFLSGTTENAGATKLRWAVSSRNTFRGRDIFRMEEPCN